MLFSMLTVGGVASVTNSKPSGPRGRLTLGGERCHTLILLAPALTYRCSCLHVDLDLLFHLGLYDVLFSEAR